MHKSLKDIRERKVLLDHYRIFRRGIVTLPYLERNLENDLGRLDRYIEVHSTLPVQEGFIEVAILAIETTKDLVESTLEAVEALMDYVATSGRVMDGVLHAKYVSEYVQDDEAKQLIINTLRIHGGIMGLLEISHNLLSTKYHAYSRSLSFAKLRTEESWKQAEHTLRIQYQGELETLEEYWKRRLEEEAEAVGDGVYFSQVTYELCTRYPDIAKKLGIDCPEGCWPIILIAVACILLCEGG